MPEKRLEAGKFYTVNELIKRMIIYSDNAATELLHQNLNDELYFQVYRDLAIDVPDESKPEYFISSKNLSSLYQALYEASYLPGELSDKALDMLSQVTYNNGLNRHLPKGIKVAHKFGEKDFAETEAREIHDCGIIYNPEAPYILCVLTIGKNFETQENAIADISKLIYDYVVKKEI